MGVANVSTGKSERGAVKIGTRATLGSRILTSDRFKFMQT